MKSQRFEAIIFDFDGVVVDSETVSNLAIAGVLTGLGMAMTAEQALQRYCGHRWSDCHRMMEEDLGRPLSSDRLAVLVDEAVEARLDAVVAIEGVADFLESQAHRRLAIASSSETEWLESSLARLGLSRHFGGRLYSASGLERGKPHPDVYLHAARMLEVDPALCLVIEDHPVGVAAGAAAEMTVIGLLAGSHIREGHAERLRQAGAGHIARDYIEVAAIIASLEG